MAKTNGFIGISYAKNILQALVGNTYQINFSSNVYMALFSEKPTADGNGNYNISEIEPSGNGYKRQFIGMSSNTSAFNVYPSTAAIDSETGDISITNISQIKFDKATGNWTATKGDTEDGKTKLTWFGLMSSQSNGNLIFAGQLNSAITVGENESVNIAAGDAIITLASTAVI